MKKFLLIIAVAFAFLAVTNAQGRFSIKDRVQQLKDSLALSDSQVVIVDSILTSSMNKMRNIPEDVTDRRQAMQQIISDANKDIEKILTDDQKAKYEKMLEERRNMMRNRQNGGN